MSPSVIYLGLGSNISPSLDYLRRGVELLQPYLGEMRVSSLYKTAPRDYTDQSDFLNAALCGRTGLEPRRWLEIIASVEKACKRSREGVPLKGPRTLDVDILYWEDRTVDLPELQVPHRALRERQFALVPLLELHPELKDPQSGLPLEYFLQQLEDQGVEALSESLIQG